MAVPSACAAAWRPGCLSASQSRGLSSRAAVGGVNVPPAGARRRHAAGGAGERMLVPSAAAAAMAPVQLARKEGGRNSHRSASTGLSFNNTAGARRRTLTTAAAAAADGGSGDDGDNGDDDDNEAAVEWALGMNSPEAQRKLDAEAAVFAQSWASELSAAAWVAMDVSTKVRATPAPRPTPHDALRPVPYPIYNISSPMVFLRFRLQVVPRC